MPADHGAVLADLPPHLRERVRVVGDGAFDGAFVLYWMRTAVRGHDNPALDVALTVGAALGRPVFVYQGLDERHPYASDRLHLFQLQGARDASAELAQRGVGHAVHVARPGHRGPHLKTLASRAALVVTEDLPVQPLVGWTRAVAATGTATWAVDTACVVPMGWLDRTPTRAYRFRDATADEARQRLAAPWEDAPSPGPWCPDDLPFAPVDVATADLAALVGAASIDHTIGPVHDTPGGSRAGYRRWDAFVASGLRGYARRRNDASADGVSRMSAYLHFGHVSPFRIARGALRVGGGGADKFLDELLVWRELAHHWCARHPDADRLDVLPDWAQRTLAQHADDPRPAHHSAETLARGRTGERLWDLAQHSLLRHGELHNNVRMTWGKAIPMWSRSPAEALDRLVDLNHRYALDGRDPASYGGLLWCLGAFDRPFEPDRPVLGTVRPRSVRAHADRLDLDAYTTRVHRPRTALPLRVAVVGGGLAGLMCARTLHDHGHDVVVLDKGRGPGGRLATRRADALRWDHGTPGFQARSGWLRRHLRSWSDDGVVAPWSARRARVGPRGPVAEPDGGWWTGTPGTSALLRWLGRDLDVRHGVRVGSLDRAGGWRVLDEEGAEVVFSDVAVVAVPAPQAVPLLAQAPALAASMADVGVAPCWAALLAFDPPVAAAWDDLLFDDHPVLSRAVRQRSKPGRGPQDAWVVHATAAWSQARVDAEPDDVLPALVAAFGDALGHDGVPHAAVAHRWRHARVVRPVGEDALWDAEARVGVCGDGVRGDGVESALLSGAAMAGHLLRTIA